MKKQTGKSYSSYKVNRSNRKVLIFNKYFFSLLIVNEWIDDRLNGNGGDDMMGLTKKEVQMKRETLSEGEGKER